MYLNIHQNPEDNLSDAEVARLTEVAQAAFSKPGVPTAEDVENHILPVSTLVTLEDENGLFGFSSTERVGDSVYAVGNAVDPAYQGHGFGKLMRLKGVVEESDGEEIVTTRTQNPQVLSYMQDLFNGYPRENEATPENIGRTLADLAADLDGDTDYDPETHVMKEAYPESMYEEIPAHNLKDFTDRLLDYENGDALLIGGEVAEDEVEQLYDSLLSETSVQERYLER